MVNAVGDPTKTEGFKDPPTNAQSKYNPGMWDLSVSKELQDWAVKDFNYAAWLYVKGGSQIRHFFLINRH